MVYDKNIHHRRSIRLSNYDYSKRGLYFVTICTQNRMHYFGQINNEKMVLNPVGEMVLKWYHELENKFIDIECHDVVIMPNHFHGLIRNIGSQSRNNELGEKHFGEHGLGEHVGSPLHKIIQWYKTMSTNEYIRGVKNLGWQRIDKRLWQRNYWEHIVRNKEEYIQIRNYINANPKQWHQDKLNNESNNNISEPSKIYGVQTWMD